MGRRKWAMASKWLLDDKRCNPRLLEPVKDIEGIPGAPLAAWTDKQNGWCVQCWDDTQGCNGTPWDGMLRVGVKHSLARTPEDFDMPQAQGTVTWDDLQAIKEHLWPGRIALEIYPPAVYLVNVAAMRWLWVLPSRAELPMNLDARSPTLMKSA